MLTIKETVSLQTNGVLSAGEMMVFELARYNIPEKDNRLLERIAF